MKKIFDVTGIPELQCKAEDYWSVIEFFKKFTKGWYDAHNIYCEKHHVYPKGETQEEILEFVYLPFKYHYLVHYFRARDAESELQLRVNFNACKIMMCKRRCRKRFDLKAVEWDDSFYELRRKQVQCGAIRLSKRRRLKPRTKKVTNYYGK